MPPTTHLRRPHHTRTALRAAVVLVVAAVAGVALPGPSVGIAAADPGARPPMSEAPEVCSPAWLRDLTGQPGGVSTRRHTSHGGAPVDRDGAEWIDSTYDVPSGFDSGVTGSQPAAVRTGTASRALGLSGQPSQGTSSRYPNDTLFQIYQRNGLMLMGALDAWDTSRGASDVTVAVISTGVQYDHPDLSTKIWRNDNEIDGNGLDDDRNGYVDDIRGWNFPADTNDPMDIPQGRGTMMAGIIGAATNNGQGIAGASWGARIMPLKTLVLQEDDSGKRAVGSVRDIVAAVCYAANNGADIVVFGGNLRDPSEVSDDVQRLEQAIRYAYVEAGVVLVAAAGDCGVAADWCPPPEYGDNPPILPAAFDRWVIGAQSFGLEYRERPAASRGYWVDISAPGEGFHTTINGNRPYVGIGPGQPTSDFAAANVAGVLAVMRSVNPTYTALNLETALCDTAGRPRGVEFDTSGGTPHNDLWGCGYVNFDRVLREMRPQLRAQPETLRQFTDGERPWPRLVFENSYLRASRWTVNPEDAVWLVATPVQDGPGNVSLAVLLADLDRLSVERGEPLQSGDPPVVARLRACPLGQHANDPSLCQDLTYELTFVDQIWRLSLPWISR